MSVYDNESIASVRKRPAMYVGSTEFFGFIHYVVSAYDLLIQHDATFIEAEVLSYNSYDIHLKLSSDANVPVIQNEHGQLVLFEAFDTSKPGYGLDGVVANALSDLFELRLSDGKTQTFLKSEMGERLSFQQIPTDDEQPNIEMRLKADSRIFSVRTVSPSVLHSYCKRLSCLHPGIIFRIKLGNEVTEYKSENGIQDFFSAVTTPYQILNKAIHIKAIEDDLKLELIFAFHSWTENQIWSFANKGRAPDGGTHIAGLMEAISHLQTGDSKSAYGVLAVLAFEYPGVTYEGCIKARVGNPELRDRVRKLVTFGIEQWMSENEAEAKHLPKIERFQFPSIW